MAEPPTATAGHPGLLVHQEEPLNAGPRPDLLQSGFLTPSELFFVRNHGAVPRIDPSFRLSLGGMVRRPLALSLADLQGFPRTAVTATLQCAGNRRLELAAVSPIPGELGWGTEAISNAEWAGASLRDVLAEAGPEPGAAHVAVTGHDETERHGHTFHFGASIPLEKALSPEVLLAYEMNGEPLPPLHGAPLRLVVPGYIGARSVKWLSAIVLQEDPSENYFQRRAYRLFAPQVRPLSLEGFDWEQGMMLGETAVNSAILSPGPGEALPAGEVVVRGYAVAGGGRRVARVDLSPDAGKSWVTARIQPGQGRWAWRLWEGVVQLAPGGHEIACRAWDEAAQTQPENPAHLWNFKGYMNNAWHRVTVTCI